MRQFLKRVIRWSNILLVIATCCAYLAPFVDPNTTWLLTPFGAIFPLLIVGNILFIVFWLYRKKWYFLFSLICIVLGWSSVKKIYGFHKTSEEVTKQGIKVMSYNTAGGQGFFHENSRHIDFKAALNFINEQEADILLLQELTYPQNFTQFKHHSGATMYKFTPTTRKHLIASKFPILNTGSLAFENNYNGCSFADLLIEGKKVRFYNIHLRSNYITKIADEVAEKGDFKEKETWNKIGQMFKGYISGTRVRAEQAKEIAAHIASCPHPVVVAGDFNDVPLSFAYRILSKGLIDNFQRVGNGSGSTFAGSIPLLRIDYIFTSPSIQPNHYSIIKTSKSDHYPVISYISTTY